jgi:hypothetical protein
MSGCIRFKFMRIYADRYTLISLLFDMPDLMRKMDAILIFEC